MRRIAVVLGTVFALTAMAFTIRAQGSGRL
jgi:hypothetical protein